MAQTFQCSLVTPEAAVFEGQVTYANLPAHDGQWGILSHHAPLVVQLGAGSLLIRLPDGSEQAFELSGGFAQMNQNRLTLLSERAEPRKPPPRSHK